MPDHRLVASILGALHRLKADEAGRLADTDLLDRYVVGRDGDAFAALVARHGPAVRAVCRRVLRDDHAADDAFQATFLALAKQAGALRRQEAVGPWLHRVAYHAAVKARTRRARTRQIDHAAAPAEAAAAADWGAVEDLQRVIDEEVDRLPDRLRRPIVLVHLLEGTQADAARELGISVQAVRKRLAAGRERLRRALVRRGVGLTAATLAAGLDRLAAAGPVAAGLVTPTVKAVLAYTGGQTAAIPAATVSLAISGVGGVLLRRLSLIAALVAVPAAATTAITAAVLVSAGPGPVASRVPEADPLPPPPVARAAPAPDGSTVVSGRVVGPDGRPVPRARVALLTGRPVRGEFGHRDELLRQGQADGDGRFAMEMPSDIPHRHPDCPDVKLIASAPGLAFGVATVGPRPGSPPVEVRLPAAGTVRGRVLDADGRPAAGVAVHVVRVGSVSREPVQGGDEPAAGSLPWPGPVVTDPAGRFVFAELDPRQGLGLEVRDDRFAQQRAAPDVQNANAELTIRVAPPQVFEGQVRTADTGRPLAHARLSIAPSEQLPDFPGRPEFLDARADADGRFRVRPLPGRAFKVFTFAPEGEPYLAIEQTISWPAGTVRQELAVALPPGVAVSGRVVDAATGRAVAGARVEYMARPATPDAPADENAPRLAGFGSERTGPDGRFFVAAAQRGVVRVFAARGNYLMRPVDNPPEWDRTLSEYAVAHAVVPLDLPPDCREHEVRVELQPAGRLTGRVRDAAGRPAPAGVLITTGPFAHYLWTGARRFDWRDGGFAVPDADPRDRYPVVVLDAAREHGAFATLPGRAGARVPELRLQPCGRAEGRFVGRDGRPLAGVAVGLTAQLSDGGSDVDWYRAFGRDERPWTDAAGRFALLGLVPGVRYRVDAFAGSSPLPTSGFTVGPGQRLPLPDFTLPRRD